MSVVSVVVPVFHNAGSLPELHRRLDELARSNREDEFEFIFVDDGSADNSFEILAGLAGTDRRVQVLKLSRNFGSNPALLAGLDHSRGHAVAVIAADLQDPPELINEMLHRWREGEKVVLAVRRHREDPGPTKVLATLFYRLFQRFALPSMPSGGFDFFLIDRQVCNLINGIQENNAYLMGLILWLGFTPSQILYDRRARDPKFGRSMWTFSRKVKYFIDSFVAFSYFPVRLASAVGIGLSLVGVIYAVIVVLERVLAGVEPAGWTSLMVVVLVASGAQLFMTGILGEYVWRNLDETRRRPPFIVERVVAGSDAESSRLPAEDREATPGEVREAYPAP